MSAVGGLLILKKGAGLPGHPAGGRFDGDVEAPAGDFQGDGGETGTEEEGGGHFIQRAFFGGGAAGLVGTSAGNEQVLDLEAEAAGTTEALDMPEVEHLDVIFGHQEDPGTGAVDGGVLFLVGGTDGSQGGDPGGVVAAAAKVPASAEAVATVDGDGFGGGGWRDRW